MLIRLPDPGQGSASDTVGREQAGPRPAAIIQTRLMARGVSTVVVVPGTTNQRAASYDFTVPVSPSAQNGLSSPTVFMPFQIRAIDASRICDTLGVLSTGDMSAIDDALRELLGL
ncbi:MAG: type II toxin-antitoxin system PemK/MazF family toxin [Acidobacteria bacterium]|nr:type II toxin-antitoxin system PemK/MazF family toxin [Planctomycetota bacterium]MBE3134170.1 type II toxin-antitoxin system PemK/MazF family toxin [Acidobacteriota bacterium]